MAERPLTLLDQPSGQRSDFKSLSPMHDSVVGYSSPSKTKHKFLYHDVHSIRPIIH